MAPSVTPWRYVTSTEVGPAHNPGIRLVTYDRTTGRHIELEQYYLDLETANRNSNATWMLEYKAGTAYSLIDLSASNLADLVERMKDPSSQVFQKYWLYYTVSAPESLRTSCGDTCHTSIICGFTNFYSNLFETCTGARTSGTQKMRLDISLMAVCSLILTLRGKV